MVFTDVRIAAISSFIVAPFGKKRPVNAFAAFWGRQGVERGTVTKDMRVPAHILLIDRSVNQALKPPRPPLAIT
jgi:hypothetical protein